MARDRPAVHSLRAPAPSVHSCSVIGPVNRFRRGQRGREWAAAWGAVNYRCDWRVWDWSQGWCCSGSKGFFRSLGLVLGLEPLLRMGWRQTSQSTRLPPPLPLLSPTQSGLVHCAQEAAFARSSQLPSHSDLLKPTPLSCRPSLVPSYSYV